MCNSINQTAYRMAELLGVQKPTGASTPSQQTMQQFLMIRRAISLTQFPSNVRTFEFGQRIPGGGIIRTRLKPLHVHPKAAKRL